MKNSRVLLLIVSVLTATVFAASCFAASPQAASDEMIKAALTADPATNVHAFDDFENAIRQIFLQQNYEELERIASSARKNKETRSGGTRKITGFYQALAAPAPTEAGWQAHLEPLQNWKRLASDPLTPTIALAAFYQMWAWDARGGGTADEVDPENWKVFQQRLAKSEKLLNEVADRKAEDPAWYDYMISFAHLQGWPKEKERKLFDEAIALDPTYRRFYRLQALYLEPQWNGDPGDIIKFANEMYVQLGPVEGPIEYFEIATMAVCNCEQNKTNKFSLSKIKQGYAQSALTYGPSLRQLNQMAFIAYVFQDAVSIDDLLPQIGKNYDSFAWMDNSDAPEGERNIDRVRVWRKSLEFGGEPFESYAADIKTSEGQIHEKIIQTDFETKYAALLSTCRTQAGDNLAGFYFWFKQDPTGKMINAFAYPTNPFLKCVTSTLMQEKPAFRAPPHGNFWNKVVVRDH